MLTTTVRLKRWASHGLITYLANSKPSRFKGWARTQEVIRRTSARLDPCTLPDLVILRPTEIVYSHCFWTDEFPRLHKALRKILSSKGELSALMGRGRNLDDLFQKAHISQGSAQINLGAFKPTSLRYNFDDFNSLELRLTQLGAALIVLDIVGHVSDATQVRFSHLFRTQPPVPLEITSLHWRGSVGLRWVPSSTVKSEQLAKFFDRLNSRISSWAGRWLNNLDVNHPWASVECYSCNVPIDLLVNGSADSRTKRHHSAALHAFGFKAPRPYWCGSSIAYHCESPRAGETAQVIRFPSNDVGSFGLEHFHFEEQALGTWIATRQFARNLQEDAGMMRIRFDRVLRRGRHWLLVPRKILWGLDELGRISHLKFAIQRLRDDVLPHFTADGFSIVSESLTAFNIRGEADAASIMSHQQWYVQRVVRSSQRILNLLESVYDRQVQFARAKIDSRVQVFALIIALSSLLVGSAALLTDSYKNYVLDFYGAFFR